MSHSHGLVDESIKRSREGVRAVGLTLCVLALAAGVQALVLIASGSVALLADRPRHHDRDPAHHVAVLADDPRAPPFVKNS